jgi:hypothetical protein
VLICLGGDHWQSGIPTAIEPIPESHFRVGHEPEDSRGRLLGGVEELLSCLGMPRSRKEMGVAEEEFVAALPGLAMTAFEDLVIGPTRACRP